MLSEHDQERFMRLWTIAQPAVGDYVHALIRDHAAAQDVLQETALVVFRRFAEYDESRPFVAWALGIARYQVLGLRRDLMRNPVVFDDEVLAALTDNWAELAPRELDHAGLLRPCLDRLPGHARRLVQMRYFEDLNASEIAQRLGMAGAAVRVALQRIREQLRACVELQLRTERGTAS
jgi:RNA polymerase sigma-70 factor (ECF subfamily)